MGAKNRVIAGDYEGSMMCPQGGGKYLVILLRGYPKQAELTKETVKGYEVISTEEGRSGASAVIKSSLAYFLLGSPGIAAGFAAKQSNIYIVAVEFKNKKRSLLELSEKYYKILLKSMF